MIDNDSRKTIKSITNDMKTSEFLIRQVVHEDIRYFSYKMRKGYFFIISHEGQEVRPGCKAFKLTQASSLNEYVLIFLRGEKFLPGSDDELTAQHNSLFSQDVPNTQSILWYLKWSLAMVTLCLHSSSHMASD